MSVKAVTLQRVDPATRKPVKRWKVRVQLPLDPVTGKRPSIVRMCDTEREAKALERKLRHEADTGRAVAPAAMTVSDLLEAWLSSRAGNVDAGTWKEYARHCRQHVAPHIGAIKVQRLSVMDVQHMMNDWYAAGIGSRTRIVCLQRLRSALDMAVKLKIAPYNVAMDVDMPRSERKPPAVWTPEQARLFLEQAQAMPEKQRGGFTGRIMPDPLWPLWALLLMEGMRRSEGLGLRWSDVDIEKRTARISQTVIADRTAGGGAVIKSGTKTDSSARVITLTRYTVEALEDAPRRGDLIVSTRSGGPITPSNVTRSFERIRKAAGLPDDVTVHGLRHTCASILLMSGVNPKVVAEKLGHDVAVLLGVYAHVFPSSHGIAADVMDDLFT